MGENSTIEWTSHTFNHVIGCTKVSPACQHCYAERDFDKRRHVAKWGPNGTRIITRDEYWKQPLRWNKQAEQDGVRRRVFCASLADVFEEWHGEILSSKGLPMWRCCCGRWFDAEQQGVPCPKCGDLRASMVTMNDVRQRLFRLIDQTPHLDWLLLTKRPENILDMWPCRNDSNGDGNCHRCAISAGAQCLRRKNVWLGCSVENQEYADKRVPELLKCRHLSPVLFLSCEPLLGEVDLCYPPSLYPNGPQNCCSGFECGCQGMPIDPPEWLWSPYDNKIDFVIVGGESGPFARPMNPNHARSLIEQCKQFGVPVFFKQWGEWLPFGLDYPGLHLIAHQEDGSDVLIGADVDGKRYGENHVYLDHTENIAYVKVGKKAAGRLFEGVEYSQFPQVGE